MIYRVRIAPVPTVIDDNNMPVADARVLEIIFPSDTVDTATGRINIIVGAGTAKVLVAGKVLRSIPLC